MKVPSISQKRFKIIKKPKMTNQILNNYYYNNYQSTLRYLHFNQTYYRLLESEFHPLQRQPYKFQQY